MYLAVVIALMFALPLISIGTDVGAHLPVILSALIIKWFGFWSVGVRLALAGARQILEPRYTANIILGLKTDESLILVRELGFANVAVGGIALTGLFMPAYRLPTAMIGGIFYALAGSNHVFQSHRNWLENVAMISDLFVAVVLIGACVYSFIG